MKEIFDSVEKLIKQAASEHTQGHEAMQYAQAALNAVQAAHILIGVKSDAKESS